MVIRSIWISALLTLMFTTSTSFSVLGSELFVADHSQQVEQVELFEFDSLTQQKHAIALAKSLRCPQCQNQNLVESNSPMAMDLRLMVYQQVRAGKSDDEIVNFMTDRYGDFVRYKPGFGTNTAILWIGPVLILLFLILWMLRLVKKGPK